MKKTILFLLVVAAFFATSCSSSYRAIREPNVKFELNSGDYDISEQVVGEATVVRVFGIDWSRLFNAKYADFNASVIGGVVRGSDNYAIHDLIEKNPGYDFIMYPQVEKKSKGFPLLYEKTKVKVTARLGKLIKK